MPGVDYGVNYLTKESEENLKRLVKEVKAHDKALAKTLELILKTAKVSNDTTKQRAANQNKLIKASNDLEKARKKESKSIIAIRENIKRINKDTRDGLKLKQAEQIIAGKQVKSIKDLEIVTNALVLKRKNLNTTTREGLKEYKALTTQIRENNAALIKSDAEIGRSQRSVGNYAGAIKSAVVGIAALAASVLAFGKAVQATTKAFAEFETGQTNVQTLLTETNNTLAQDSIDLMVEYGLSVQDTNKALFDAVSAGVEAGDSVQFLGVATRLAVGGVTDLTTSVDGITSVLNAYGLSISEADKVSSAFFSAQKFGKTTVAELSQEIGTVAPIANQAGISFQELLTSFAVLTKQGIKTNEASTALKATITALIKPSVEAKEAFNDLGIQTGVTALKQQGFSTILGKIAEAVREDNDVITTLIPNVRALTGVGALGTRQLEEYEQILKTVSQDYGENSSLARAYTLQQDTLNKTFDRFTASATAIAIAIGERLAPALKAVLNFIVPVRTELEKTSKASVQQRVEFESLVGTFQRLREQTNKTAGETELLRKTYEELQRLYPEYFKNLKNEADNYEEIDSQINSVRESLVKLATEQAKRAILLDQQNKLAKIQENLIREQLKLSNDLSKAKQAEIDLEQEQSFKGRSFFATEKSKYLRRAEASKQAIADLQKEFDLETEIAKKREQDIEKLLQGRESVNKEIKPLIIPVEYDVEDETLEDLQDIENLDIPTIEIETEILPPSPENQSEVIRKLNERLQKEFEAEKKAAQKKLELDQKTADESDQILDDLLLTEKEKFEVAQFERLLVLQKNLREGLMSQEEYNLAVQALNEETANKYLTISDSITQQTASFLSNTFTSLLSNLTDFTVSASKRLENFWKSFASTAISYITKVAIAFAATKILNILAPASGTLSSLFLKGLGGVANFAKGGYTGKKKNRLIQVNDDAKKREEFVIAGLPTQHLGSDFLQRANNIKSKSDADSFKSSFTSIAPKPQFSSAGSFASGGLANSSVSLDNSDVVNALNDVILTVASSNSGISNGINSLSKQINAVSASDIYVLSKKGESETAPRNR